MSFKSEPALKEQAKVEKTSPDENKGTRESPIVYESEQMKMAKRMHSHGEQRLDQDYR